MSFYDHYASRKRNKFGERVKINFANKLFKLSINDIAGSAKILEIGPGDGYIASLSAENNYIYLGIEGSPQVFKRLNESGYNIIKAFVPPLPDNIGKFDVCFALHIIEHLNSITDAQELIRQISNSLPEGGKIVIATPDFLKWGKDFYNCDYTHNLPFTLKRLSQLFVNENFIIEFAGYYVGDQFGILRYIIYWLGKLFYFRSIDNNLKNSLKSDLWYRAYLTCLPNIAVIARKK